MPNYTKRANKGNTPETSNYKDRKSELKDDEYSWSMDAFEQCWAAAMKKPNHYATTKKKGQVRRITEYTINDFLDDYLKMCDALDENKGVSKTRRSENEVKALIRGRKAYVEKAYNDGRAMYDESKKGAPRIEFPNFAPATSGGFKGNGKGDYERRAKLLEGIVL